MISKALRPASISGGVSALSRLKRGAESNVECKDSNTVVLILFLISSVVKLTGHEAGYGDGFKMLGG